MLPASTFKRSAHSRTKEVDSVQHLIVHAVHPIRPQQVDGLANQIRASTVEHPEAQVQMELICGGLGVEALEGAEAALGPDGGTERRVTALRCDRFVRAPQLLDVPSLITPFRERLMSPVYSRQTLNLLYRVCNYALARGKI